MDVRSDILDAGGMAILRKRPAAGDRWPRVVMFHDGPGVRRATHEFAAGLAAQGFDVAVPDLYHRHGRLIGYEPDEREADPSLVDRLRELMGSLTDDDIQSDLDVTLTALEAGPHERLATIGFCLGARAVFRSLMRLPERLVVGAMWHPSFLADDRPDSPHLSAGRLAQPLYIGIGDADRMQPIEAHQRFFDAVAPLEHVEVDVLPGADHGFTWPGWPTYDEHATTRAFERTLALFRANLP